MKIIRSVDPTALKWLKPGASWEEDSMQRAFAYYGESTWRDAERALAVEKPLVAAGQLEFPEADYDDPPDDPVAQAISELDLGVAGMVLALNLGLSHAVQLPGRLGPRHGQPDRDASG